MTHPQSQNHHIPYSVIKTSREELDIPELQIHKQENKNAELISVNQLPEDFHGYAFIVGALFQAEDRPQEDGTLLYTGDGMIYRLGFEDGKATLKTRIAKTPCYYADLPTQLYLAEKAIEPKAQFAKNNRIFSYFSGFRDGGQSRYSLILGSRNQLNTAFLQTREHLLVTIDAGRPYIIDPDSLELIFPDRHFACSPQFIPSSQPCPEGKDESTHGYIVCIVLKDDPAQLDKSRDEFWIFHADDFNNKPIYRLSAPVSKKPLNLALTLHSTWLRDLHQGRQYSEEERRQKREASIKLDYDHLLKEKSPTIQNLFHDIVYPNFIDQRLEEEFEKELLKSPTEL